MLTQKQLDKQVRKHKGSAAVEELIAQTKTYQYYGLSDGTWLRIKRSNGVVAIRRVGNRRFYTVKT